LLDIYGASIYLPGRSNAQIKYLIDNDENVLDLTKTNQNIFAVQNIFKSGQTADVSLFEYDEKNPYSQQLVNNPTLEIFEGGFRYLPILHNISGSSEVTQSYTLLIPEKITVPAGGNIQPTDDVLQISNWSVIWESTETQTEPCYDGAGTSNYTSRLRAIYKNGSESVPYDVSVTVTTYMQSNGFCGGSPISPTIRVNNPNVSGSTKNILVLSDLASSCDTEEVRNFLGLPPGVADCPAFISNITAVGAIPPPAENPSSNEITYYTSIITGSTPCLYFISESNQLVFNSEISYFYNKNRFIFNSYSDPAWTGSLLNDVILPFSLEVGDRISFYDSASRLGWTELEEYVVKNVSVTGSITNISGSRLLAELDRSVNIALFTSGSTVPTESFTGASYRACRYIVWKHVPDETNVMLRYNPKDSTIVENGILFPQYIDPPVRDNSGNVIKALKQQNLIDPDTNTIIFQ
jgi:hypothetical protein